MGRLALTVYSRVTTPTPAPASGTATANVVVGRDTLAGEIYLHCGGNERQGKQMRHVCQHNIMNLPFLYVYLVTICIHFGRASSKGCVSILFLSPAHTYPAFGYFINSCCICSIKWCNDKEFFSVVWRGVKTCHKDLFKCCCLTKSSWSD